MLLIQIFLLSGFFSYLQAGSVFSCSASVTGPGVNIFESSATTGSCNINYSGGEAFVFPNGNPGGYFVRTLGVSGVTITASGSMFQDLSHLEMVTGGVGNAILRVNYRWRTESSLHARDYFNAVVSDPDPSFFVNNSPLAAVKTNHRFFLGACSDDCNLWLYQVDIPITFGVPYVRSWSHLSSASHQDGGEYGMTYRIMQEDTIYLPTVPLFEVFDLNGNSLAFTVTPVPEPGTLALVALAIAVLAKWKACNRSH